MVGTCVLPCNYSTIHFLFLDDFGFCLGGLQRNLQRNPSALQVAAAPPSATAPNRKINGNANHTLRQRTALESAACDGLLGLMNTGTPRSNDFASSRKCARTFAAWGVFERGCDNLCATLHACARAQGAVGFRVQHVKSKTAHQAEHQRKNCAKGGEG